MNKLFLLVTVVYIFAFAQFAAVAVAQSENEGYSESYLQRPIGARAIGMAGNNSSVVNDPNTVFGNPAGLSSQSEDITISSMFSALQFGRFHSSFALAQNFDPNFGVGIGFNFMNNGQFIIRDKSGNSLGNGNNLQYSINVGCAYSIKPLSFGITGKYLRSTSSALVETGEGFAFDAGTYFTIKNMISAGIVIQNVGFIKWNNSSSLQETLPWMLKAGISTEIPLDDKSYTQRNASLGEVEEFDEPSSSFVLLSLESQYIRGNNNPNITFGVDYGITELLSLRSGIALFGDNYGNSSFLPMNTFSGGLSYKFISTDLPFRLQMDYAASREYTSQSSITHHVSFIFQF